MGGAHATDHVFTRQRSYALVTCEKLRQWQGGDVLRALLCCDAHGATLRSNGEFRTAESGVDVGRTALPPPLGTNWPAAMAVSDVECIYPIDVDGLARVSVCFRPLHLFLLFSHETKPASRGAAPWSVGRFACLV